MTFLKRFSYLASGIVAIVACSVAGVQASDDELIVYSGRSDKFVRPVVEAFTEKTGVKVVLHTAESTALLNKLRLEGGRTPADLFLSNDAGNLQLGSDAKLFRAVSKDIASAIPSQYRAADNTWIGLSARARVLVINTNNVEKGELQSVFDLADPKWLGRLGITNATNESFIAGVTVYLEATDRGQTKAWLEGLKANINGGVFSKHSHIVNAVARGKKDAGLVNHYYIYRHLAENPNAPIAIVLPDQGENDFGIAWNVAGIAVTKHSKKLELAEQLIAFLVSEEGQKMFAEANREYPTREGVPAADMVPPAGSYKVAGVPMSALGAKRNTTIDLLEEVGMP